MLVFVYDSAGEPKKSPGTVKVFAVASAMASSNLASAVSRRTLAALKVTIGDPFASTGVLSVTMNPWS